MKEIISISTVLIKEQQKLINKLKKEQESFKRAEFLIQQMDKNNKHLKRRKHI